MTMTFCALCSLTILGDTLERVERRAILDSLPHYQRPDGSFTAVHTGGENDMRFVYCACSVCTMLGDWSTVDKAATKTAHSEGGGAGGISRKPHRARAQI